jgi:hypothetical protein
MLKDMIPLSQIPSRLPLSQRTGEPIRHDTVQKWTTRGCRGVKLEVTRVGGSLYTSEEALNRFIGQLNRKSEVVMS